MVLLMHLRAYPPAQRCSLTNEGSFCSETPGAKDSSSLHPLSVRRLLAYNGSSSLALILHECPVCWFQLHLSHLLRQFQLAERSNSWRSRTAFLKLKMHVLNIFFKHSPVGPLQIKLGLSLVWSNRSILSLEKILLKHFHKFNGAVATNF